MTTTVPPELMFHIINFLRDDKAALSACSLSCSALSIVSKSLLFHTLRTGLDSGAADRFESLLESGSGVLPFIKKINVAVPAYESAVDERTILAISQIMVRRWPQGTPPKLSLTMRPRHLMPFRFGRLIQPRLGSLATDWVTSLELDQLDLSGDIHFWNLILAFPELTSLILGCVNVGDTSDPVPSDRVSEISHLSLKGSALCDGCDIRWFLAENLMPLPSLTSLDVRFPTALDQAPILFGERYGATVKTLRFGVVIIGGPTLDWDKLAPTAEFVSRFRNLETLTFQGLFVPNFSVQRLPVTFEWIPVALGGVTPTVQKLTMEVIAAHLSHLDNIPWSTIDERLAHVLRSITVVEILLATPVGTTHLLENVHQEMRKRLPLAAQRDVLRCSAVSEHPI